MSMWGWFIGLVGITALVVGLMAAASYSQATDFTNQTDSFGSAHTPAQNLTAGSIDSGSTGAVGIGSGILIFAAAIILVVIMLAAYALVRKPKW